MPNEDLEDKCKHEKVKLHKLLIYHSVYGIGVCIEENVKKEY